jgi:pyruvate/2-oxoglutarate dehydrogenase complex dihydrolipoamide acyltransferase (E2) component
MARHKTLTFPKSRLATIDICELSQQKHHVTGFIEIDVTGAREKIRRYKRETGRISFTAWLVKAISVTVKNHESVAAFLYGKRRIVVFDDINISIVVEKKINGQKVPIPLVIEKANERTIEAITKQITDAQNEEMTDKDIVLHARSTRLERLYYHLPGFARRLAWRYMLKRPSLLFGKMGNVAITSLGMMGSINGWFVPKSIHPVCFGISSIIKKPVVVDNTICIREMLNMTILIDHDVIDGAPVARFINELSENIKNGIGLQTDHIS